MPSLPSGLSEEIADHEPISRFLTSRSWFSREKSLVKYPAFMPHIPSRETSVYRHGGNPADELWAIGDTYVKGGKEITIHGSGVLASAVVRMADLDVSPNEPPPRHAAIRNWFWDDTDLVMQKAQQLEKAKTVAAEATLLLR